MSLRQVQGLKSIAALPNVTATAMEMRPGRRLTTGWAASGPGGYRMRLHEEDRRLAARVLAGDARAFEEFFASYFARLYRFAVARVGADEDAAGDIVQETLCRAMRSLEGYRGEASLFTWLCQICRSQLADRYERVQRDARRLVAIEDDAGVRAALESLEATGDDPELAMRRNELSRLVQAVLDRLPARYGDALEWKYVEGLSVDAIAVRLSLGTLAAQSLLQRARTAFRDGFREMYGADIGIAP
ncbi:MAG TPA: RNA polymerase sigma factor [Steroidobacteraceae bacterium]|nr:RNA polymerase sigma factor [Steroidobacteraceae bacterium]